MRNSNDPHGEIFELISDAVIAHRDGEVICANSAAAALHGADRPEDLLGKSFFDLVHPDDFSLIHARRKETLGGRLVEPLVRRALRLDGSEITVETRGSRVFWDGRPTVLIVLRDITRRRKIENALRESEEKYRDLIEGSLLATLIINDKGERLYVNKAFLDLFGYDSAEEYFSLEYAGALAAPYERERLISYRNAVLAGDQELHPYEFDGVRKDGSIIPVQAVPRRLVWDGQNVLQRIYIDLTDRKIAEEALRNSEERYRKLLEFSTDAIYVHKKGKIVLINPAGVKVFGATSADQIIGMNPLELIHSDYQHEVSHRIGKKVSEGTLTAFQEQKRLRIDGSEFWSEVAAVAMEWEGERGAIVIVRDITSQKEAEAILSEAKNAADLANRTKSEFLANMSHELRTPLNAIIGFSDIIGGEALGPVGNPKYLEYVKDIKSSGTHLLELINDILDLSKIEAGKHELHEQEINVHDLLRSCFVLVNERALNQGVEIDCEIQDHAPSLFADVRNLKQIFLNVLTNAIKFTPQGGKIAVTVWSNPEDGYVFRFADTGIGIAPDDIPKALASFGQVDSELGRAHQGTGLGLPLTKSLVELHDGSFDLESEVDVGTTITVRFPNSRIVSKLATGT